MRMTRRELLWGAGAGALGVLLVSCTPTPDPTPEVGTPAVVAEPSAERAQPVRPTTGTVSSADDSLAVTGTGAAATAVAALATLGAGAGLLGASRRRRTR